MLQTKSYGTGAVSTLLIASCLIGCNAQELVETLSGGVPLAAPAAAAGAIVFVDGRRAGVMKYVDGSAPGMRPGQPAAVGYIWFPPGTHMLKLEKDGRTMIQKRMSCPPSGECYLALTESDFAPSQQAKPSDLPHRPGKTAAEAKQ